MSKRIIKEIIPTFISKLLSILQLRQSIKFEGIYHSWEEAIKQATGYNSDSILNKVKEAALKVKNKEAAYERDSFLFYKLEYPFPLLAGLLKVSALNKGNLTVLDFGGSLGSTYYQCRGFLNGLQQIRWSIVEQESFVKVGKELFEDEELRFYYTIEECLEKEKPDVIIFSGVLQYLENPYLMIDKVKNHFKHIIIDRTPFVEIDTEDDILTIQIVPSSICKASYPVWLFNFKKFLDFINTEYKILSEFSALDGIAWYKNIKVNFKGFILEKI